MRLLATLVLLATFAQAQQPGPTLQVTHGGTGRTSFPSGQVLVGNGTNQIQTTNNATSLTVGHATALSSFPAQCPAGEFIREFTAVGVMVCAAPPTQPPTTTLPFSAIIDPLSNVHLNFGTHSFALDFDGNLGNSGVFLFEHPGTGNGVNLLTLDKQQTTHGLAMRVLTLPTGSGFDVPGATGNIDMRAASKVTFTTGTVQFKATGMHNAPLLATDAQGDVVPGTGIPLDKILAPTTDHSIDMNGNSLTFNSAAFNPYSGVSIYNEDGPGPITGNWNNIDGLQVHTTVRNIPPVVLWGQTNTALTASATSGCVMRPYAGPGTDDHTYCVDPATVKPNSIIGASFQANVNDAPAQVCERGSCRSSGMGITSTVMRQLREFPSREWYSSWAAARFFSIYSDGTRGLGGTGVGFNSQALLISGGKSWFNGDIVLQSEQRAQLSTSTELFPMTKAVCDDHTPGSIWVETATTNGVPAGTPGRMIVNGGTGWAVGNTFTIPGPSTVTHPAIGRVTFVLAGGTVRDIVLEDQGFGYTDADNVTVTPTSGSGTGLVLNIHAQTNRGRIHYANAAQDSLEVCEQTSGGYVWSPIPAYSAQKPIGGQVPIWNAQEGRYVPGVVSGTGGASTRMWTFNYDLVGQGGQSNGPINYLSGPTAPTMPECNAAQATPCELELPGGGTTRFWYIKARVPVGAVEKWTLTLTYRTDGDASAVLRPTYRCVPMGTVPNITTLPTASSANDAVESTGFTLPAATPSGAIREASIPLTQVTCADNSDFYVGFTWTTVTGTIYFSHFGLSIRGAP
jgi:hypothetical protein